MQLERQLSDLVSELFPGGVLVSAARMGADEAAPDAATEKGIGYGVPIRLTVRDAGGRPHELVFHTATGDDFGHDRRADRAAELLLAFDSFGDVPGQVRAVDVGAVTRGGQLRSLREAGELYLVTEFAPGELYADDLRRIAREHRLEDRDHRRSDRLAAHLAEIHRRPGERPAIYTRAIRDLVGAGEGIFGIVDGYPQGAPGAPPARLRALERAAADWRWRLRGRERRLSVIHGDPHPFNVLFDADDRPILLDAARGARGDPADDVVCLSVNYVFFATMHPGAWQSGLRELWRDFWSAYMDRTEDWELLEVAPPYLAWRLLVLANPLWYPNVPEENRDALLRLAERALEDGRLDLEAPERMFR